MLYRQRSSTNFEAHKIPSNPLMSESMVFFREGDALWEHQLWRPLASMGGNVFEGKLWTGGWLIQPATAVKRRFVPVL